MKKKLKLLIVDDEKYVRDLLRLSIDWPELGIELCGAASCAEEALLMLDDLQPQIVITDICMDNMNGIEFSKYIMKHHPFTKIIILSGHSQFDYAARSIDIGVSAYLLKPLDEEKIIQAVQKVRTIIDEETGQLHELEHLKAYLRESRDTLIENNLNALMEFSSHYEAAIRRLDYLGISFGEPFFQVASIAIDQPDSGRNEERQFLLEADCHHIITKHLEGIPGSYLFFDLNHNNTILFNCRQSDLRDTADRILAQCRECLDGNITIGIGKPVTILPKVKESYQNAKEAVRYRAALGNNQVILYENIAVSEKEPEFHLDETIALLLNLIKNEQLNEAFLVISDSIRNFARHDASDIVPVRILSSAIVNHLTDLLLQKGLRDTDAFHYSMQAYDRLFRLDTVEELHNMLNNLVRSVIETFQDIRSVKNNVLINKVTAYVTGHYADPMITLSAVAEEFHVNPSYLSRLFKQQTGMNFVKYLTELRLQTAAHLLRTTNLKAYEVGLQTGMHDAKYFSTCFRKYYGMTVKEYRNQERNV